MGVNTIGVAVTARRPSEALEQVRKLERLGVSAAWLTSGGGGGDSIAVLAAAAAETERILLGTSIVQTWSRHPVALAQQVQVVADLAPGRFRLGNRARPSGANDSDVRRGFQSAAGPPEGVFTDYQDTVETGRR